MHTVCCRYKNVLYVKHFCDRFTTYLNCNVYQTQCRRSQIVCQILFMQIRCAKTHHSFNYMSWHQLINLMHFVNYRVFVHYYPYHNQGRLRVSTKTIIQNYYRSSSSKKRRCILWLCLRWAHCATHRSTDSFFCVCIVIIYRYIILSCTQSQMHHWLLTLVRGLVIQMTVIFLLLLVITDRYLINLITISYQPCCVIRVKKVVNCDLCRLYSLVGVKCVSDHN